MAWGIPTQNLPTFGNGFMKGYGFVKGLQNQQARLGLQRQRENRAQQTFDMRKQAFEQEQADRQSAKKAADLQRYLGAAVNAYQAGGITAAQPYWAKARKYSDALPDITTFLADNYGNALQTADYGLSGKAQLTPTQIADTAHTLFPNGFNKGAGEKTADGSVLLSKRPVRFYPHPDPNLVIPEYEVTRRRPDGTTDTYLAPHTPHRLSTDEEVSGLRIPDLVDKVKGLQLLRNAFIASGGNPEAFQTQEQSADWRVAGSGANQFLVNQRTGETRPLDTQGLGIRPAKPAKPTPKFDNTYYKTITRGLQAIHANKTDAYGNPIVLGNAAALAAQQAKVGTQLAQQLEQRYGRRIPAAVVVDAVSTLEPPLTPAQAKKQAETQAAAVPDPTGPDFIMGGPDYGAGANGEPLTREQFIQQSAQQLMAQSRAQYRQQIQAVRAQLARAYGGGQNGAPAATPAKPSKRRARVAHPATQAEFDALPAGTVFINPADGSKMVKS